MKLRTLLWIALGIAVFAAYALLMIGSEIWFKHYTIGSGAMEPALAKGDRVFVRRTKTIARGDLAVYWKSGAAQVKRTIALGGDTITIREKTVIVNGAELIEPYAHYDLDTERVKVESLRVPAGHIFVLGDNRDNANDSRYQGVIAPDDIIGRVVCVWSFANGLRRPAREAPRTRPARSPE